MVFPGVLRGHPGPRLATTPTNPTTAKPVVPVGMSRPSIGRRTSAADFAQLALDLPRGVAGLDRLALVVEVLALCQRDLALGPRALAGEVHPGRDQRQAALVDPHRQPLDLATVQQQLARTLGLVVVTGGRAVGRDVEAVEPALVVPDRRVGVLELGPALAQRLDLGPLEHDAALEALEQVVT